jgi:hypothetical protein
MHVCVCMCMCMCTCMCMCNGRVLHSDTYAIAATHMQWRDGAGVAAPEGVPGVECRECDVTRAQPQRT